MATKYFCDVCGEEVLGIFRLFVSGHQVGKDGAKRIKNGVRLEVCVVCLEENTFEVKAIKSMEASK
ncbi:MAG: hypothetical protein GY861_13810 [bacterium]|nr:hypothetical protein [bacterium]